MISIVNYLILQVGIAITFFIGLLPLSPFNIALPIFDNQLLQFINYVFPFVEVVAIFQAYLLAVAIFYGIRIILRWLKVATA